MTQEAKVITIDMKTAVRAARQFALELFETEALPNLALEEIEFDESKHQWQVTLGFDSPHKIKRKITGPSLFPTIEEEMQRKFKLFSIDAEDGHLLSMTMRSVVGRLPSSADPCLSAVSDTLGEWNSAEDREAWRGL